MSQGSSAAAVRRYALGAIVLHWTIAVLIVLQVVLSGRMDGRTPEAFASPSSTSRSESPCCC
jgi:cytochrome b561